MLEPTFTQNDLIEACGQPGCPACWLSQRTVSKYIYMLFYEHVNDVPLRAGIRASLGYCPEHTWALRNASLGNALGVSIIYHDILTNILRALPASESNVTTASSGRLSGVFNRLGQNFQRRLQTFRAAFQPQAQCPACAMRETTLDLILPAFARGLKTEALVQAYSASTGFCLPHLQRLLLHVDDPAALEILLTLTRQRLEILDVELAEYIRKNDHRFSKETWGSERDAWKRVIPLMAGESLPSKD